MAVALKTPSLISEREQVDKRPSLVLVPAVSRRYASVMGVLFCILVLMCSVVVLRVHMAQQQMRLDKLNSDIYRARQHSETLRAERARMQSPIHLIGQAQTLGMVPSLGNRIVAILPSIAAEVASTVGKIDADVIEPVDSPLDQFGRMKSRVNGAP